MTAKSLEANTVVFLRKSVTGSNETLIEQYRVHAEAMAAQGRFVDATAEDFRRMLTNASIGQGSAMTISVR